MCMWIFFKKKLFSSSFSLLIAAVDCREKKKQTFQITRRNWLNSKNRRVVNVFFRFFETTLYVDLHTLKWLWLYNSGITKQTIFIRQYNNVGLSTNTKTVHFSLGYTCRRIILAYRYRTCQQFVSNVWNAIFINRIISSTVRRRAH